MYSAHSRGTHPEPRRDPDLRGIDEHERCGFDSIDALDEWFDGWATALAGCGFVVTVYDVPDWAVRVGRHGQIVFDAAEAVEVDRYPFKPVQAALFA
ncbi:hypothetical protein [Streptomyces sp. NPDC005166]